MLANLLDNQRSWELRADGTYVRVKADDLPFNLHRYFMTNPSLSGRGEALDIARDVPRLYLSKDAG